MADWPNVNTEINTTCIQHLQALGIFDCPSHSLLPAILPACTIHAALCLEIIVNIKAPCSVGKRAPYLLTDPLPAVLAFDSVFDDRIVGRPSVHKCNSVQRDTDADEVEDFVDKSAGRGKERLSTQSVGNIMVNIVLFSQRQLRFTEKRDGKRTYPQDMITAPSSSANFIVLYPRPGPWP